MVAGWYLNLVLTAAAGLAAEVDGELLGDGHVHRFEPLLQCVLGVKVLPHHGQGVEFALGPFDLAHRLAVGAAGLAVDHELVAELFELPDHLLGFGVVLDGLVGLDERLVFGTLGDPFTQLTAQIFECCGLNAHGNFLGIDRYRCAGTPDEPAARRVPTGGLTTEGRPLIPVSVVTLLVLTVVATAIVWKGSELLDEASQRLALHYGLPAVVQGAVIVAIGSSFPEVTSVVLGVLLHGTFDLGVGTIVGSAIFNILVIPAVSAIGRSPLTVNRAVVYKEAQFYMLSIAVLLLTFSFGVIYNTGGTVGTSVIGRPLALIPLAVYGLYLFIQYQDITDYEPPISEESIDVRREWLRLAGGLALIVVGVEGLIRAALGFGDLFGSPEFIWGLIIVAAGTSLPDAIMSVRAAARGAGEVSLSNVLGSNTFDLLVALPVGVLLVGSTTVDYALAVPMMGVLTLATIVLFTIMRTKLRITSREARLLLGCYGLFVGWIAVETIGYVDTLPGV